MAIRKSVIDSSGGGGFNLNTGTSGNTTFDLNNVQPAGQYSIDSANADSSIEFYLIAEDGSLAGYTNTKVMTATAAFSSVVVYGASNNDLITFDRREVISSSSSGDKDSGAAPFIDSVNVTDLPNIDDTIILTGGNFATNVTVTFTGADSIELDAKSIVRTDSTQLLVTRPDNAIEDNAPFTITVTNPGIPNSTVKTFTQNVTVGADPIWSTSAGAIAPASGGQAYSFSFSATDPDSSAVNYSLSLGSLPTSLSLSANGTLSGNVAELTEDGNYTFTITATDEGGNASERSFNLNVKTLIIATGGIIADADGYRTHTFTASDTFNVSFAPVDAKIDLVAAAGGGGGGRGLNYGGGGGGGGLVLYPGSTNNLTDIVVSTGSYNVLVGAGGAGATVNPTRGTNGQDSSFDTLITSKGGGGGGAQNDIPLGKDGGSGGGGGYPDISPTGAGQATQPSQPGLSGTYGFGFDGGAGNKSPNGGGGGGGAGGVGQTNDPVGGGQGKDVSAIFGQVGESGYLSGGGGGSNQAGYAVPVGGIGGGGSGTIYNGTGTNSVGQVNTGGGGGAGGNAATGKSGGSGIVIIRYPI